MSSNGRVGCLLVSLLSSSCWPTAQDRDCYDGLELGGEYEIHVVATQGETNDIAWPEDLVRLFGSSPRCNGVDGLRTAASFRLRLTERGYGPGDVCRRYTGIPIEGVTGVDFTSTPRRIDGLFGVQVFTPDGYYKLWAWSDLTSPVGVTARAGEPPAMKLPAAPTSSPQRCTVSPSRLMHPSMRVRWTQGRETNDVREGSACWLPSFGVIANGISAWQNHPIDGFVFSEDALMRGIPFASTLTHHTTTACGLTINVD